MSEIARLQREISALRVMIGNMMMPATVHEVKGDRIRLKLGDDKDGKPVLGPWVEANDPRGGARRRSFFKKDQTILALCPNGDPDQAIPIAGRRSKDYKAPDHANTSGQDEETFQLEDLRVKKTKKGYAIWLQKPEQQQQQQQQQQSGGGDDAGTGDDTGQRDVEHKQQKPDARVAIHLNDDGGVTARVGKDMRFMVSKEGVKMKAGSDFAVVQKGKLICSKEWVIGSDPLKDDDKLADTD